MSAGQPVGSDPAARPSVAPSAREHTMALLADSAAVVLLVTGFMHLLFTLSQLDVTWAQTLGTAMLCVLLVVLLTRRWWFLPALLAATAAAVGFLLFRAPDPVAIVRQALDAAQNMWWVLTGYTPATPAWSVAVVWLVTSVAALSVFLIVRRLFHLLLFVLATAAVFLSLWLSGQEPAIAAMALCATGLAVLFPRGFARAVNRRARGGGRLERGIMQTLGVPVCLLVMLLSLALIPADTSAWRWRPLVNSVRDLQSLIDVWRQETRPYHSFSIAMAGFEPHGRLGGPIQPSGRELLRIRADAGGLYLRGGIRDRYTGSQWLDAHEDAHYRFGSLLWRGRQNEAFDLGRPAGSGRDTFLAEMTQTHAYGLTHMVDGMPFFFTGARPERLRMARGNHATPFFNAKGEIYTYDAILAHQGYTVRSRFFPIAQMGFYNRLLRWEQQALPDPDEWIAAVRARYLTLPDDLPATVYETANAVAGQGTPAERALALWSFFQDRSFRYTLEPVMPPESDFVAHFLETRAGYCVYFATALAVMARTQDLPSRYVEGFVSADTGAGTTYAITGRMAHAWVEIYLDGIGWVPFDPTPAHETTPPILPPAVTTPVEEQPTPAPEPSFFPVTPVLPPPTEITTGPGWGWILAAVLLLAAPPGFWLWVRWRRYRLLHRFRLSAVRRRFANRERQMECYHREILRQLACLDLHPQPGETLSRYAQRADRRTRLSGVSIEQAFDIVLRRRYGLIFPRGQDIAVQSVVYLALERHLLATLTSGQYVRKRVFGWQALLLPQDA